MESNRNQFYDVMRGVAILLVVLGHGIQYGYSDYDNNILFRIIYSFHMPLFMFISGLVVPLGSKVDFLWLKRKFFKLVIPFVAWIFLPFLFSDTKDWNTLIQKVWNIIQSPDRGGLWFLWVLFLNCCALYVGVTIYEKGMIKNELAVLLGEYIVIFLLSKTLIRWLGAGSCAYHFVYYSAGYLISKYRIWEKIPQRNIRVFGGAGTLLYIVLVSMWRRTQLPLWLQPYEALLPEVALKVLSLGFKYITAFCGIIAVWYCVKHLFAGCHSVLALFGRYTLEIYALHGFFITMFGFENSMLGVMVNSTVSLLLSLMIAYSLENGKAIEILFGKRV